jgi:hypothetical protein
MTIVLHIVTFDIHTDSDHELKNSAITTASLIFQHTNVYCGAFGSSTKMNLSILTVLWINEGRGNSLRSNRAGSSLFTRLITNKHKNAITCNCTSALIFQFMSTKTSQNLSLTSGLHLLYNIFM